MSDNIPSVVPFDVEERVLQRKLAERARTIVALERELELETSRTAESEAANFELMTAKNETESALNVLFAKQGETEVARAALALELAATRESLDTLKSQVVGYEERLSVAKEDAATLARKLKRRTYLCVAFAVVAPLAALVTWLFVAVITLH